MDRSHYLDRIAKVYAAIVVYKAINDGISPSLREIMDLADIPSTSMVQFYLNALEEDGVIKRHKTNEKARGIKVIGGKWIPPERK